MNVIETWVETRAVRKEFCEDRDRQSDGFAGETHNPDYLGFRSHISAWSMNMAILVISILFI